MGYLGKWLRQRVIERIPMQLAEWLTSLGVFLKQSDEMVCLVVCFCCFSEWGDHCSLNSLSIVMKINLRSARLDPLLFVQMRWLSLISSDRDRFTYR